MYTNNSPTINLHGETRDTIKFIIEDFIKDNIKMQIEYIGIIHGKSSNILKNEVHLILKNNKNVDSYKVNIFNPGLTIVKLKIAKK